MCAWLRRLTFYTAPVSVTVLAPVLLWREAGPLAEYWAAQGSTALVAYLLGGGAGHRAHPAGSKGSPTSPFPTLSFVCEQAACPRLCSSAHGGPDWRMACAPFALVGQRRARASAGTLQRGVLGAGVIAMLYNVVHYRMIQARAAPLLDP